MAKYDPKRSGLACLPEGVYDASVIAATETTSKSSGAPMLKLDIEVYADSNVRVTDYLMIDPEHAVFWKFKKMVIALAGQDVWDSGDTDTCIGAIVGRTCKVELKVESDETYGDKNRVWKYIAGNAKQPPKATDEKPKSKSSNKPEMTDEDIPF